MKNTLMLIDMSMMLYRAAYANPYLKHDGIHTGAIFGCVQQLTTAILEVKPSLIIPCFDCPPYFRSKEFSDYKKGRSAGKIGFVDIKGMIATSSNDMADAFMLLGIPHFVAPGFEADDLIAYFCYDRHLDHESIIIVSSDSDLYQMFELHNVQMWNSKKGYYGRDEFLREFNVDPAKWPDVLAMAGTHNAIEGIRGIGKKTACKIVRDGSDKKWEKVLIEYRSVIDRNVDLIDLPHVKIYTQEHLERFANPVMSKPDKMQFVRWLDHYGISFTKRMDAAMYMLLENSRK